jgi:undecaprenyl-phosphate galactose phosphotransferase/putative colanic acid biosynthesis UDP-glucose lipid carrier transferase
MAIGSKAPDLTVSAQRTPVAFPCEAIPYLLSTVDALIILSAGLLGCFAYQRGQVEMAEVTVAWLGTALLLAFFAFLFKIGGTFSRGAFLIFLVVAPIGLLAKRKFAKFLMKMAVARGAVGRRDVVLFGDPRELELLGPSDVLSFFGASEVHRFVLSADQDWQLAEPKTPRLSRSLQVSSEAAAPEKSYWPCPGMMPIALNSFATASRHCQFPAKLLPDAKTRALSNYASS